MANIETYAELEYQRRHLLGTEGKDREMVMSGIDRLLDSMLDTPASLPIETHLAPSKEGQAHLERGRE